MAILLVERLSLLFLGVLIERYPRQFEKLFVCLRLLVPQLLIAIFSVIDFGVRFYVNTRTIEGNTFCIVTAELADKCCVQRQLPLYFEWTGDFVSLLFGQSKISARFAKSDFRGPLDKSSSGIFELLWRRTRRNFVIAVGPPRYL